MGFRRVIRRSSFEDVCSFFWCGGWAFLQGFLRRLPSAAWYFAGELVVFGVVMLVS
jgi:hypothetical protein